MDNLDDFIIMEDENDDEDNDISGKKSIKTSRTKVNPKKLQMNPDLGSTHTLRCYGNKIASCRFATSSRL